jgi:hypothetical protein
MPSRSEEYLRANPESYLAGPADAVRVDSFRSQRSLPDSESATVAGRAPASRVASQGDVVEPISPELALVDPELAARVRASPVEHAAAYAPRATGVLTRTAQARPRRPVPAHTPVRPQARPGHRRAFKRIGISILAISLMVSGFVVGSAVSGNRSDQTAKALPEARATSSAPRVASRSDSVRTLDRQRPASVARTVPRKRAIAKPRRRSQSTTKRRGAAAKRRKQAVRRAAVARRTSAAVERKLLSVIVQSPAGKLPPVLINKRTGLPKNNLQAVCTRSNDSRSFLCVVTSALQPAARPVYAFYRSTKTGRGGFTWYRSRSG